MGEPTYKGRHDAAGGGETPDEQVGVFDGSQFKGGRASEDRRGPIREELLRAAIRIVAKKGYEGTRVRELADAAGVTSEEFYENFENKDACVLAAYDWVVERVAARAGAAWELSSEAPWPERIRQVLAVLLEAIGEHPIAARMALIEVPPVGPAAHARYRAAVERLVPIMQMGREYSEIGEELPENVELMAIGSVEAIVFDEVAAGKLGELRRMLPEILFAVLVPFLGPEDAAQEMHAASAPAA